MYRTSGWLMLPALALCLAVLGLTHGHFTYTLDDPYIHLALARNIGFGHYGINLSEASAPSSSPLWPLLLAPFAHLPPGGFELVPLAINLICLLLTLHRVRRLFMGLGAWPAAMLAGLLGLVLNWYGLPFNGLEHSLQVMLCVYIAGGLVEHARAGGLQANGAMASHGFWLSLMALPLVRYEGLAVVVPALVYLAWHGQWRPATLAGGAALLGLAAFTVFLHGHDLGFLPSSIVAKSQATGLKALVINLRQNLHEHGWLPLLVLACRLYLPGLKPALGNLLLATVAMHMLAGHHGSFGRYEVYVLSFVAVVLLDPILARWQQGWRFVAALPLAVSPLLYATLTTPWAALNIYSQQVQMADMVKALGEGVAVNDLGLVSLRGGQQVLDLFGLGSIEALRLRKANPDSGEWMDALMARKGIEHAMVYEEWFPHRPRQWIKVGELRLAMANITLGGAVVSVYARSPAGAQRMAEVMSRPMHAHPGSRQQVVLNEALGAHKLAAAQATP